MTRKFPVLHYGSVPRIKLADWSFRVFGEVAEEKRWNWTEFNQSPRTQVTLDLRCVTRWSKFDTGWEGVSVKTPVEQGYTTTAPLELLLSENMLSASATTTIQRASPPCLKR